MVWVDVRAPVQSQRTSSTHTAKVPFVPVALDVATCATASTARGADIRITSGKSDTTVLAKALQQGLEEFGLAAPEVVISRIQDLERLPSRKLATLRAMSILTRFP
jgi:hypothetical protein